MSRSLAARSIATRLFRLGEPLIPFLLESLDKELDHPGELEGSVLAVTSKIVSLAEGRVVPRAGIDKETLVRREADRFLGEIGYGCFLTIKHGLFIPSAGIDESNAEGGHYILYPEDPLASARAIRRALEREWGLKQIGVLLTDSHTSPLRAGVTGVALAYSGFRGVQSRIGAPDLFGKPLRMTQVNVADALAAAAVFCMGEADERTPLARIPAPPVEFVSEERERPEEARIAPEVDLYAPLYREL